MKDTGQHRSPTDVPSVLKGFSFERVEGAGRGRARKAEARSWFFWGLLSPELMSAPRLWGEEDEKEPVHPGQPA